MKKLYSILYAVLLLCVVGTGIFIILSPDRIPMHYNAAGEVDRIGSKYENLILPVMNLGMGAFFLLMAKGPRKKGERSNERILLISGICTLLFLTLLSFYFMWKALRYDPENVRQDSVNHVYRFVSIGMGALLVILGNIMPKLRRNAMLGLRTKWSLANDRVWQKSQRFGGMASVAAGLVMIILAMFIPGTWNLAMMAAVTLIWVSLCVWASRRYYLEDNNG